MTIFLAILAHFTAILNGTLFVSWLLKHETEATLFEKVLLGIGTGFGLVTLSTFVLGVMRVPYTFLYVVGAQAVIFVVLAILLKTGFGATATPTATATAGILPCPSNGACAVKARPWVMILSIVLVGWLALKAGFVLYEGFVRPLYAWDVWANWGAGAKLFYYSQGLLLDDPDFFFGTGYRPYPGHPVHSPLLMVWVSLWTGSFNEALVKSWSSIYYLGMLGLIYAYVRKASGSLYSLVATVLLSTLPIATYHAVDGYSDLALGYLGLASLVTFWRYLVSDSKAYLGLSAVFLGLAVFTKNEGLFFFIAIGTALFLRLLIYRKGLARPLARFVLIFVLVTLAWFAFKFYYGFGFGHGAGSSVAMEPGAAGGASVGLLKILELSFMEIFLEANEGMVFPLAIAALVFGFKDLMRSELKYLFFVVLSVAAMFLAVYVFVEHYAVTNRSGIHRNILTLAPSLSFATALLIRMIVRKRGA